MNDLPTDWTTKTFSDVFDRLQYGFTAKALARAGVRFLRITDIDKNGEIQWGTVPSCEQIDGLERYTLNNGDFVFARSGSVEKAARIKTPPPAIFASYLIRGTPIDQDDADWLAWFVRSPRYLEQIREASAGIGLSNVNATKLAGFTVPFPPSSVEKSRIVAQLNALMAHSRTAREELARIPQLVERYKHAILAAAFDGELTAEWRKQRKLPAPAPSALDGMVAKPIRNGLSVRGSDNPPGVRSLRLSALRSGIVDLTDVRFLQIPSDQAAKYLLQEDDVLISRGNGTKSFVGLAALVPVVAKKTIFPDTAFRIRLDKQIARPAWFTLIWNSPQVRTQIESSAKTTAGIWKVSQGDIGRVELKLPHPAEQDEISRRIQALFSNLERTAQEVSKASSLLDRLEEATLAKAFRGELVSSKDSDVADRAVAK